MLETPKNAELITLGELAFFIAKTPPNMGFHHGEQALNHQKSLRPKATPTRLGVPHILYFLTSTMTPIVGPR